ncbi:hypothetical protein MXB_421 [Myxobolus squamalis]|nr:hypothetical protein MXB_421 [Myxobolus squamalis]
MKSQCVAKHLNGISRTQKKIEQPSRFTEQETDLKFRSLFNLSSKEELIAHYSCSKINTLLVKAGCLYVSRNYLCFYSYFFGVKEVLIIPYIEIKKHIFSSFKDIHAFYKTTKREYKNSIDKLSEFDNQSKGKLLSVKVVDRQFSRTIKVDSDVLNIDFSLPKTEIIDENFKIYTPSLVTDLVPFPGSECRVAVSTNFLCIICTAQYHLLDIREANSFVKMLNRKMNSIQPHVLSLIEPISCGRFNHITESMKNKKYWDLYNEHFSDNQSKSKYYTKSSKLKTVIATGNFHAGLRPYFWPLIEINPGYYEKLVSNHNFDLVTEVTEDIEKDLHRSLPEFTVYNTSEGQGSLRRVLLAYATHNPNIVKSTFSFGLLSHLTSYLSTFTDESEAFTFLNYVMREKVKFSFKLERVEEIDLCKLVMASRKEYKKINNRLITELRARMQHAAILKVETRNFNSIIRIINRKFGLKENHIKYLFDRFKECHYKTIFWGDQEVSLLLNKMSWKTAIDRFLVDSYNFRIIFNEIFTFGVNQIKFSDLCFNLLSRRDRNEGLVDFSQFISLYVIIKSADFALKLMLIYQMAFYNVSTRKSTSDTKSLNDTDTIINLSMPSSNKILNITLAMDDSSYFNSHNDKVLTNILEEQFLPSMQQVLNHCPRTGEYLSWYVTFNTIKTDIEKFPEIVQMVTRKILINNMDVYYE